VAVDEDGTIVGQSVTSAGRLIDEAGASRPILALGPISVAPEHQGRGIGGELIRATAAAASELGWPVIVLVGHATYYPRFGFESARSIGIEPPEPWSDEVWMALRLPSWTPGWRGTMHYPPAFAID
jgi:putative acetyltransferase